MMHEIPVDGAPHAPSTECGCGVRRVRRGRRWVYVHTDQSTKDRGR